MLFCKNYSIDNDLLLFSSTSLKQLSLRNQQFSASLGYLSVLFADTRFCSFLLIKNDVQLFAENQQLFLKTFIVSLTKTGKKFNSTRLKLIQNHQVVVFKFFPYCYPLQYHFEFIMFKICRLKNVSWFWKTLSKKTKKSFS